MASVSTYLNFMGDTAAAFEFYREVFGTEYASPVMRLGDGPAEEGAPELSDADKALVMHVALPIIGGHVLMGTDMIASAGHVLERGNNVSISLQLDTRADTQRLFDALSAGGSEAFGLQDMFWGSLWGTCVDRFGTRWMFNCDEPA